MRFGFLIDHRRCIGCHACSVACKEEHQVPIGVYRTWVKVIEKGTFPDVRRTFSVLRCNHCDSAPCITICPTAALFRRDNGIVDFDSQQCIGCKACMQACPYDALYIDPQTQTAAKCNFCAHRVETGLKPSCEVVCPEQAILSGDLDDPASQISRFVSREPVTVRKPEQGTRPKLFYREVDAHNVDPAAAQRGGGYQFATEQSGFGHDLLVGTLIDEAAGRPGGAAGQEGRDGAQARTTYDVVHHRPWGLKVSAYVFTKSIAAGGVLAYVLGRLLGAFPAGAPAGEAALVLGLVFLAVTGVLLIADLKQPMRFWKILVRPQWRSWLAIGSYVILAYGGLLSLLLAWRLAGIAGGEPALWGLTAAAAALTAIYTAFLFAQAEGRDYWQNPVLPVHLLAQAFLAGAAVLLLLWPLLAAGDGADGAAGLRYLRGLLVAMLALDLVIVVASEAGIRHGTRDAAAASRWLTHGPAQTAYIGGVVLAGHVLPLILLLATPGPAVATAAALLVLAGLLLYEHLWILAGQSQPLS